MAQNTVGHVCARALEIAQLDSTFLTLARQYYNQSIHDLSTDYDFPFYQKQASDVNIIQGTLSYALPADYSRSDTCYLVDGNNNRKPIIIMSKTRFDQLGRSGSLVGDPSCAYIDLSNRKIVFDASTSDRKYRLTYFRSGTEVDEAGSDDADTIDCESPTLLVSAIVAKLTEYTDDERAGYFQQKLDKSIRDYKMNSNDQDDEQTLDLARSKYKPGRRATRGGGYGVFD
jgi:hypothetical protein